MTLIYSSLLILSIHFFLLCILTGMQLEREGKYQIYIGLDLIKERFLLIKSAFHVSELFTVARVKFISVARTQMNLEPKQAVYICVPHDRHLPSGWCFTEMMNWMIKSIRTCAPVWYRCILTRQDMRRNLTSEWNWFTGLEVTRNNTILLMFQCLSRVALAT